MKLFLHIIRNLSFLLLLYQSANSQVRLPRLVRDSMILQRDTKIRIWGWATAGEKISISFNSKKYKTTADNEGNWSIFLSPTKAGGPYNMKIDASNHLTINNILVGDVWLCAGQSNMVHQMHLHAERYANEIASANYPQIRQFVVPGQTDLQTPRNDLPGGYWKSAIQNDILQFSVVAYFFAKKLYDKYQVPIGIINSSVGGPPIESWMSEQSLKAFPNTYALVQKNKDTASINSFNRSVAEKNAALPKPQDKGLLEAIKWFDTSYIPEGWKRIAVPGYWEDQGAKDLDGIVWYRKEINIPAPMANITAKLHLGRIVDADVVYVNGKQIGNTTYQYPQRRYHVPAHVLRTGKNILVVRVTNYANKGGFVPDKPYYLTNGTDTIPLAGYWYYKVGDVFTPEQASIPAIALEYQPTSLYNAMIAPITNYTIKGFIWYQGEGNINKAPEYGKLLPALIKDWRSRWQQGELPFLYVQLPNFGDMQYKPAESNLAVLRHGQMKTLSVPNTQMAVTIDLGEWNDIHPGRKKEVGERLATAAMHLAYGEKNIVPTGPIYRSAEVQGNKIIISFNHTGSGLITNDGKELSEFAIAGADKKFAWAKAKMEGEKIIVWNEAISHPLFVRYAWADSPVNANLYNKEGLPASPFEAEVLHKKID